MLLVLFISTEKKVDQCLSEKYKTIFTLFIFAYAIMINFEPFINGDMRLLISMLVYINYFNEGAMEGKTSDLRRIKVRLGSIRLN